MSIPRTQKPLSVKKFNVNSENHLRDIISKFDSNLNFEIWDLRIMSFLATTDYKDKRELHQCFDELVFSDQCAKIEVRFF